MIDLAELRHIFDRAAILPVADRPAFLEEACRGDAELRREIDLLLTVSAEAGSVFDTMPLGESADSSQESSGIPTAWLAPGTRLGPYEIVAPIAAGGVGEVYAARDTRLRRNVAIKVLRQELASDPGRLKRFEQEARAASALNHPNIITVYDFGQEGRTPYIAMEQVEGTSLRAMLCGRPLPIREVLQVGRQIADGLTKAHAAGIVHRDLKPENVMVTEDGHVKIVDFGLAKLAASASARMLNEASTELATASGMVMGTAGYMSPEQAAGHHVDHRCDQFALGLILYEMTTGNRAFKRTSAAQTLAAIIDEEPEPLLTLNPDAPPTLSAVVARCLCKSRHERYESTRDLARALTTILETGSTPVRTTHLASRTAVLSVAVVLVVTAASAAAWLVLGPRAVHPEVRAQSTSVVAVLPFKNLSGEVSQAYFAAGMTEEIRSQLSKLAPLRLLSRSATERYGDGDVRRLASELSAAHVIEGSVRLDGDRVRIGVAVIDARNDQTIWSDQFERTLDGVTGLQGDIALQIAAALKVTLSPDERQRIRRSPTDNAEAYQLYLRTYDLAQGSRPQNIKAVEMLATAVQLDPRFALAQARMAYYLVWRSLYDGRHHLDNSIESSRKALAIDPTLAYSHSVLASALTLSGRAVEARLGYLKALQLDPSDATNMAMANLSVLEAEVLGRHDEALYWARRSLRLDHNRGVAYYHVGLPLLFLREDELTERWLNTAQSRFPDAGRIQLLRILLQYMRGYDSAAVALARDAVAANPGREEFGIVLAELSFLTSAPDAEARVEPYARRAPEITAQWRLKPETFRTVYAYLLARRGETARASVLLEDALNHAQQALAENNESQRIPIEIAAIHTVRQQRNAALEWLDRGYSAGYRDYETIGRDPMFEPLRNDPRFQDIRERMKQDVAGMRARSADLRELREQVSSASAAKR